VNNTKKVIVDTIKDGEFFIHLGNFLDEFYISNDEKKQSMIEDSPLDFKLKVNPNYLAFIAATAHKLANDYKLTVPDWVFDSACYLSGDSPYFTGEVRGTLRLFFLFLSPTEFKHRNLFVDENVLQRV
jgi:hypothetical protein